MATKKKRTVQSWTRDAEKAFRSLVKDGIPTQKIARELKRTAASIRSKAQKLGLSLGGKKKTTRRPARKS